LAEIEVVLEDENRALIGREAIEGTPEHLAIDHGCLGIRVDRTIPDEADRVRVGAPAPSLAIADIDQEPIRPSIESGRVSQLGKIAPDQDDRLLSRVLGEVEVTEDPVGDGEQARIDRIGDLGERRLIPALRLLNQPSLHDLPSVLKLLIRPLLRFGTAEARMVQILWLAIQRGGWHSCFRYGRSRAQNVAARRSRKVSRGGQRSVTEALETGSSPSLEAGREAVVRHDWSEAVDALTTADREKPLLAEDLERLGTALWWAARPDDSNEVLERAFNAYTEAGRMPEAAWMAMVLAYQAFRGLNEAVGGGWVARAERILADLPEGPMHARLGVFRIIGMLVSGNWQAGLEVADQAIATAQRYGETSAMYSALSFKGMAQLFTGNWQEGLKNLDEAAAAVATGDLDLRVSSDIYCNTIAACWSIGDLARAGQWAEEGERWMRRNGSGGYPGVCKVHRAELKMLRGNWPEAEQEARQACQELERFRLLDSLGWAQAAVGEVRRRMGDLDGAAQAFEQAYANGNDAMPGLALLQLERGEIEEARRSLGRVLAAAKGTGVLSDRATRARLLPAQVEITLAAGDLEAARAAVEELEAIAIDFERPMFKAGAMTARGELLLGENRAAEASPVLSQSWRLWQTSDLPYEAAKARLHYAEALAAEGDQATARRDLLAARTVFERLGATNEIRRVNDLLGQDGAGRADGAAPGRGSDRVTRTFMFTDIVTSTDLLGIIGDEAWGELLRWHDRELRDAIGKHGGVVIDHTGDGFFAAFERAGAAIDSAVEIQRRLLRHRREHGFAPWVRIGLHTAEATREGGNYRGGGVHVAARVGAAASREEILVSQAAVEAAGAVKFGLSEPRKAALKGVREPIEVRAVEWR
jgi:class 3 adenylate cyclase